jgi:hypothetical protein
MGTSCPDAWTTTVSSAIGSDDSVHGFFVGWRFYTEKLGFNADVDQRVSDDAHSELVHRGVEVSEVQHFPWGSFVFFSDPDGNGWAVQQVPVRE